MKEVKVTIIKYEADDGEVFSDKADCEYYEWRQTLQPVWFVINSSLRMRDAMRGIETYSTEELAKNSLKNTGSSVGNYTIIKQHIDEVQR